MIIYSYSLNLKLLLSMRTFLTPLFLENCRLLTNVYVTETYGAFIPLSGYGHKIHQSNGDRYCEVGQKENVCLFCSYVFFVRTGQTDQFLSHHFRSRLSLKGIIQDFF